MKSWVKFRWLKWVGPVEVGELGEFGYQVLPYLEGYASLDDILAKRNADSSLRKVIRLIAEIADALDGLHAAGVIHADVKPSNILVAPDQNRKICLIDFGMILRSLKTQMQLNSSRRGDTYTPSLPKGHRNNAIKCIVVALASILRCQLVLMSTCTHWGLLRLSCSPTKRPT